MWKKIRIGRKKAPKTVKKGKIGVNHGGGKICLSKGGRGKKMMDLHFIYPCLRVEQLLKIIIVKKTILTFFE